MYIEHPMDYPYQSEHRITVELNTDTEVLITPEMIFADEALNSYDLKDRNCYITEHELGRLKFFKVNV